MPTKPTPDFPEWTKLADETLTLWQDYLTATANDPKQKAELAKLAEPLMGLGQSMFAEWTRMLQNAGHASPAQSAAGSASATQTAATADPAAAAYLAQLTGRVAELEQQLAELERQLAEPATAAAKAAPAAGTASRSTATAGRRRRAATDDHSDSD